MRATVGKQKKLLLVILCLMIYILFVYPVNYAQDTPSTYVVQRGDVQNILSLTGFWLPRDQQSLSFTVPGVIQSVNVEVNDVVTIGTVLATYGIADRQVELDEALLELETLQLALDSTEEGGEGALLDAQFALASARLGLQQTLDAIPGTSISAASLALQQAQENLENAERNFNNVIGDPTNGPSAVDGAYEALQAAIAGLSSAQIGYWSAAQSFNLYDYSILSAENNLLRSELSYQELLQSLTTDESIALLDETQARVDQLTMEIEQSSLFAPFTGVILEVDVSRGESVTEFENVITLALSEPLEIYVDLSIEDTQQLEVGLIGVCEAIDQPDSAVQCIVRQLPTPDSEILRVAASFDNVERGQLIDVSLPIGARENVLWLPPEAIRSFQSRTFVVVQTPSGENIVDVTIGLRTADRVEITSGLNEGDIVVGPEA